jgi:hypothetical protein
VVASGVDIEAHATMGEETFDMLNNFIRSYDDNSVWTTRSDVDNKPINLEDYLVSKMDASASILESKLDDTKTKWWAVGKMV